MPTLPVVAAIGAGALLVCGGAVLGYTMMHRAPADAAPRALVGPITTHDFVFDPARALVKAGTTVTWQNLDPYAHTVTSDDGTTLLDSGDIGDHASWSFTFTQPGTFHYRCVPHSHLMGDRYQGMVGSIEVTT